MQKLIFINRYFYPDHSATSQMLSDLAFNLNESADFNIHIVTSRQCYDNPKAELLSIEAVHGVTVHRIWTSGFGRQNLLGRAVDYLTFYLSAAFSLYRIADRKSVLIAKTDPPLISIIAAGIAHWRGAFLVNWIQDLFPEVASALGVKFVKGPVYNVLRWLRNLSLRKASVNVVIGELMKERLEREGISPEKLTVIHNWADAEQVKPVERQTNRLRREWGLENKFVVGYSGNFGRGHDFSTLLDAASELVDNDRIIFLLIGGGANLGWIKSEAERRNLKNVIFKPYQPREVLSESLSASDVHLISLMPELGGLIVPSKFYGVAAVGRPVILIGSNECELAHIIRNEKCGYVIDIGCATELKQKIIELESDVNAYQGMSKNIYTKFINEFSLKMACEKWKDLFFVDLKINGNV